MSIRLSLAATRRTLTRRAENANSIWLEREALLLTLTGSDGQPGQGEVAPLPGFSPDSLAACHVALSKLDLRALPASLSPGQGIEHALREASAALPQSLPAARAGFESALVDLWARAAGVPAWAMLAVDDSPPAPRRISALLMGEPEAALPQALAARARGLSCFKLKIGRPGAFARELVALQTLRRELGPAAELRLDANRSLPRERLRETLEALLTPGIELFEEPASWVDLTAALPPPLPLALDESLAELTPEAFEPGLGSALGLCALVLKPTLLGGVSTCLAWARAARRAGLSVVLSHSFEGPLGLSLSAALALSVGSPDRAHGLDLVGARLPAEALPYLARSQLSPWLEAGWGYPRLEP